ncbi:hypothetical protein [Enterococcus rivorum]|uniref:hypothetical protein n=1 Tax=Enterococcus rivorum TaxID=762845 RepID=UPI001B805106|nr:hypothetical protein [Enterococcus rivorum]
MFIIFSIIVLLIGFLVFINYTKIFAGFGYRTLKPKQEITVEVKPKVEQVDYNSTLRIVNKDGLKLKLTTGRDGELWHDLSTDTFFDTITKEKTIRVVVDNKFIKKNLPINKKDGVSFDNNDFIMEFKGEKTFDVTNNKNYTIKIENVSNHSGKVDISVENT